MSVVPVLMYHSVTDRPTTVTRAHAVPPALFGEQMRYLHENGVTTLRFVDLVEGWRRDAALPPRPLVITFDDGYADTYEIAMPILRRFGLTATVFVTTGWLRDAGRHSVDNPPAAMMSWDQVRGLADAGIEIGAHTHSHPQLDQLAPGSVDTELTLGRDLLQDHTAVEVRTLAYPFGYSSRRVRAAAHRAGYAGAAAVDNRAARPGGSLLRIPRLTVRSTTSSARFARVVTGDRLASLYAVDRTLTAGWLGVRALRRTRRLVRP